MTLQTALTEKYMSQMVATPKGRAHILSQIAEAEDNGEARVFDDALALVDDPELAKMIERHRDDEIRHGKLFRERVKATGVDPGPVAAELLVLDKIDRALGGFFNRPITDDAGVLRAYLILQVLEERALDQFSIYERVFRDAGEVETADVFREVAADERRHLKYCHAISRRYAKSEESRVAELERMRVLEAKAFRDTQTANMQYVRAKRLMPSAVARFMWTVVGVFARNLNVLPLTSFAQPAPQPA